jgi:hypothetical protein
MHFGMMITGIIGQEKRPFDRMATDLAKFLLVIGGRNGVEWVAGLRKNIHPIPRNL